MSDEKYITLEGKKELEQKLEILKTEMVDTIKKIKEAREFGDLSENAEYDAAKNEQAQLDAQINEIETTLRVARIIDSTKTRKDEVSLGSIVTFLDLSINKEFEFKIVGSLELVGAGSTKEQGIKSISNESPIGRALMGKKKGDEVNIVAPGGQYKIRVVKIKD